MLSFFSSRIYTVFFQKQILIFIISVFWKFIIVSGYPTINPTYDRFASYYKFFPNETSYLSGSGIYGTGYTPFIDTTDWLTYRDISKDSTNENYKTRYSEPSILPEQNLRQEPPKIYQIDANKKYYIATEKQGTKFHPLDVEYTRDTRPSQAITKKKLVKVEPDLLSYDEYYKPRRLRPVFWIPSGTRRIQSNETIDNNSTNETIRGILPFNLTVQENDENNSTQNRLASFPITYAQYRDVDYLNLNDELKPYDFPRYGDGGNLDPPEESYAYCYPFLNDEIITRCGKREEFNLTGIYIPMMMDIQYRYDKAWYNEIKKLREKIKTNIIGIAYGSPNWELIIDILEDNQQLFNGVLLEWVDPNSCITQMKLPTAEQLKLIADYTTEGILRYFVRQQDFRACGINITRPQFYTEKYETLKELSRQNRLATEIQAFRKVQKDSFGFPIFIQPLFFCSNGQEGLCYHAINSHTEVACSNSTRYIFNPYEINGGRLMHMLNETCAGLTPHDLYGVL